LPDAVAHGKVVLAGIIGGQSVKALDFASSKFAGQPELYFTDLVQETLFRLLARYSEKTGGAVMPARALEDLMGRVRAGMLQQYTEEYAARAQENPEWHEFVHSVLQLRNLAGERATGETLATAAMILRGEVELEDGTKMSGHADAREFALTGFADAERIGSETESPEGDVSVEGNAVLADYASAKALQKTGRPVGVQLGIPSVDEGLGGGLAKGLTIAVAGTTVGKSSLCVQAAWYNAVMEGRHVLYFTTEQARDDVRLKIIARHSRLPKFGLERGLDTARIRSGWLSDGEEAVLADVVSDLKGGGYGEIQLVQMPSHCTVSIMAGRAENIARRILPELVVADYLQLFEPERRGRDTKEFESQSGIVKAAHSWATTCFRNIGVALISPWQLNRNGSGALKAGGAFSLDEHMASSSEAARTAGTVISMTLREEDSSRGRQVPLQFSIEKNRGGARGMRYPVTADYATSYFADRRDDGGSDYLGLED
jgi:replicative DNA helicase